MRKGFSTSKKVGAVFWIYIKRLFLWMLGVHALDYLVHECTNSLGLGWVGVYIFCVWECEVGTVWKGWKTDRNTVLCWECNLAWIKSSFPGSCSICCRLPGNGIFFFSEFLQVKPLQNGIKWGIFFPIECWSVGGFGADSLETEESWVLETAGGVDHVVPAPKPLRTPC